MCQQIVIWLICTALLSNWREKKQNHILALLKCLFIVLVFLEPFSNIFSKIHCKAKYTCSSWFGLITKNANSTKGQQRKYSIRALVFEGDLYIVTIKQCFEQWQNFSAKRKSQINWKNIIIHDVVSWVPNWLSWNGPCPLNTNINLEGYGFLKSLNLTNNKAAFHWANTE